MAFSKFCNYMFAAYKLFMYSYTLDDFKNTILKAWKLKTMQAS